MNISGLISGGFLKNKKTLLVSGLGMVSCVVAYLVGDIGVVDLCQIIVPLFGVMFLGKNLQCEVGAQIDAINKNLLHGNVQNMTGTTVADADVTVTSASASAGSTSSGKLDKSKAKAGK